MEEMTRKQPDVDKVTKTYKRKTAEPSGSLAERRIARKILHNLLEVLLLEVLLRSICIVCVR